MVRLELRVDYSNKKYVHICLTIITRLISTSFWEYESYLNVIYTYYYCPNVLSQVQQNVSKHDQFKIRHIFSEIDPITLIFCIPVQN